MARFYEQEWLNPSNYTSIEAYYKAFGMKVTFECPQCGRKYLSNNIPEICDGCGAKIDTVIRKISEE